MLSLLILWNNSEPFLNWIVTCNEKWILYDSRQWPAQWLDRGEAPKHFSKPNLHQKKGHSHWFVVCCHSDPLQLSESLPNHYVWEVCSANRWDVPKTAAPATSISQQDGPRSSPRQWPTACHKPTLQKLNDLDYEGLLHPPHSPDLLPNNYHFISWQLFTGKTLSQPVGGRTCFPRVHRISKHRFLC